MAQKALVEVNALVVGRNSGFSLLELLVAMFLLGLMATFGLKMLQGIRPVFKQEKFVENVRTVLAIAWQRALATGNLHRVYFDLEKRVMVAEMQTNDPNDSKEIFAPVARAYDSTTFTWPEGISIKQFFIQETDRMHKSGSKTTAIWFYVLPDGMVQPVIINLEEMVDGSRLPLSIVVNPFTAQLTTYDTFQKP